ncbi:MAG: flagellar motor stator protein MotA, partial [Methylococcales bacterium]
YVLVVGAVLGGFVGAGGHLGVLVQPFEVIIIFGAAMGAFLGGNSLGLVKRTIAGATGTIKSALYTKAFYLELVLCFYALTNKTRKEGLLSLEALIESPDSSTIFTPLILADHHLMDFICDHLRLIVTGVEVHQLEELMDQEIEIHHEEAHGPIKAIQRIGDGMPAFGIVAAVMGVVHTMESISLPPAELGKLIAAALVGTFLGILISYGFIAPVASSMEERAEASTNAFKCAQKGLLCCAKGISPAMTAEYMRAMITSDMRPGFAELESQLKASK